MKSVKIHVKDHVELQLLVEFKITWRFALAKVDLQVIHSIHVLLLYKNRHELCQKIHAHHHHVVLMLTVMEVYVLVFLTTLEIHTVPTVADLNVRLVQTAPLIKLVVIYVVSIHVKTFVRKALFVQ